MPKVKTKSGIKHFAYTPEGIAAAQRTAKIAGNKMMVNGKMMSEEEMLKEVRRKAMMKRK